MRKAYGESTFVKLIDVTSVPTLLGAPEQIDITTLSDNHFRNMNGLQAAETLEFGAWYTKEDFKKLDAIAQADLLKEDSELDTYQVWFGENGIKGKFEWQGRLSVSVSGFGVNEADPMTVTISDEGETGIQFVDDEPTPPGPTPTTYTVTLPSDTNVECSNTATSVNDGASYSNTITAATGYTLGTVTVTMGGTDITSTAWNASTGAVTIASVTGNIIITATAA
jgi:hypothetical protein